MINIEYKVGKVYFYNDSCNVLYIYLSNKNGQLIDYVSKKMSERLKCDRCEVNSPKYYKKGLWCDLLSISYNNTQDLPLLKNHVTKIFEETKKEFEETKKEFI